MCEHASLRIRDSTTLAGAGEFKGHERALFLCKSTGLCRETNALVLSYYAYTCAGSLRLPRKHRVGVLSQINRSNCQRATATILFISQQVVISFFMHHNAVSCRNFCVTTRILGAHGILKMSPCAF